MPDMYDPLPSTHITPRRVDVYLPSCYSTDSVQRFPVLYMHDGQNVCDPATSFMGVDWGVYETQERLSKEGVARPVIIVAIWNTPHRVAEYMPAKPLDMIEDEDIRAQFIARYGTPQSDAYLRFIVEELKPFIDATYRTLTDRDDTYMMGSSMGGLISLYALCKYPDIFGGVAALSTHWPAGDGCMYAYLDAHLPSPDGRKIYVDHGTETLDALYEDYQKEVDCLIRSRDYVDDTTFMSRRFSGHEHSEVFWRERVHIPLTFLLGK